MSTDTLPVLPEDCVFEVLQYLSAKDLVSASRTCKAWRRLSDTNTLWQRLCLERWTTWPPPQPFSSYYDHNPTRPSHHGPPLEGMFDGMSLASHETGSTYYPPEVLPDLRAPGQWYTTPCPPYEVNSWREVYQERHEKDVFVRMLLEEMIEDSRNRMRHIDGIANIGMVHARDVLENIIAGRHGEGRDLTRVFYARKTLKRLRRGWVLDQWRTYRTSQQSFPIWQGCALMSMFSNHEMELSTVDRKFQDLADEFLAKSSLQSSTLGSTLGRYSPSSFSTHDAGLSPSYLGNMRRWSETSDHNQGGFGQETSNERHSRYYDAQVERIKLLVEFFTQEKGFKGNTDNYYDPFNSLIDKVLTRRLGIPISLCIVFSELAHRVGIAGVDLMGFPQHFMVRFRPSAPSFDPASTLSPRPEDSSSSLVPPPTYYLDLFHPPHRLLSTQEYENYFSTLNIPQPAKVYRDLPTPPLEIFLRCLRNIILAVEQTGGAGRIGSDHQTSLYSGITQLLALHPSEEWGLYVLWLKYLSTFWPEDVGFIRTSIDDMELIDHRRSILRGNLSSPSQGSQRPRHMFGYHQGTLHNMTTGPSAYFASSTHETIKILRAQVRELEMMDEAGEVSEIRRRRRPKVTAASPTSSPEVSLGGAVFDQGSPSLPTIDSQPTHSLTSIDTDSKLDEREKRRKERLSAAFGGEERRRPEPLYYVGEVFQHLIYRYTGTIYGYDLKCEADENWIISMGIDSLTHGRKQPFYNALLSDGSRRYVAQENIQVLYRDFRNKTAAATGADQIHETENATLAQGSSTLLGTATPAIIPGAATDTGYAPHRTQFSELGPLEIETVGQYFEAWDGQRGHYVMNKELRKVYPTEDYL